MRDVLLIVDDLEVNRMMLREMLQSDYDILEAGNGIEALELMTSGSRLPQAVLLDIMMPGMDGFEVFAQMKENWKTRHIPVLIITATDANVNEPTGLRMGAMDYISRPFNPDVVKARVDNCIQLQKYRRHLESLVERKTREVTESYERMMEVLANIIEYRSFESSSHIRRTGAMCEVLVSHLMEQDTKYRDRLQQEDYKAMLKAMPLHDIGKIAIPDHILLKPDRLTDEEFAVVKEHSVIGYRILKSMFKNVEDATPYMEHGLEITLSHHERWDGSGYPNGIAGEKIPISCRILAIVDVFDALASERCYKSAYPYEKCLEIMSEERGKHFDPDIFDAFMTVKNEFICIHSEIIDSPAEEVFAGQK